MRQTVTYLVDDLDGSHAAETLTFGVDDRMYEIDLSEANAAALRATFAAWASRGRTGGRQTRRRSALPSQGTTRNAEIRAWAAAQGLQVTACGRIPAAIVRAFDGSTR